MKRLFTIIIISNNLIAMDQLCHISQILYKTIFAYKEIDVFLEACKNGRIDIVRSIIDKQELDINAKNENGECALDYACAKGHLNIVKLLIHSGADINSQNPDSLKTPLYYACASGSIELVRYLLESGADIEARNTFYETPLLWSIRLNLFTDIIHLLIEHGANIYAKDNNRTTILHRVSDNLNLIKKIVTYDNHHNLDFNARDRWGNTILHKACKNCNFEVIEYLLTNHPYLINKTNQNKKYALSYLSPEFLIHILSRLEKEGVEIHIKDKYLGDYNNIEEFLFKKAQSSPHIMHAIETKQIYIFDTIKHIKQILKNSILSNEIETIEKIKYLNLFFDSEEIREIIMELKNSDYDESTFNMLQKVIESEYNNLSYFFPEREILSL